MAGVFVFVGLATASILLWIVFAVRRRRRSVMLEHDSATLAAVGFHRAPLDDDDDGDMDSSQKIGYQRRMSGLALGTPSSVPSAVRTSGYLDSHYPDDAEAFNQYQDFVFPGAAREGHIPFANIPLNGGVYAPAGDHAVNHSASHSAGSYEPLLAYHRSTQPPSPSSRVALRLSDPGRTPPITPHPLGLLDPDNSENNLASGGSSSFLLQCDERLDPGIRQRLSGDADNASQSDFRDEEDYSRPILGVRGS